MRSIAVRTNTRALIAALAASALLAGSADAATVRLGSSLTAPTTLDPGYVSATTLAISSTPAPGIAASPVDGTVISWSFIGAGGGPFVPRIVRPTSGGFTGAGTGAGQANVAPPAVSGPFATSLPIRKGDLFGVSFPLDQGISYRTLPGATGIAFNSPTLADMAAGRLPSNTYTDEDEMMAATVRYCVVPNLRGKSPKDARKALTAADCTAGKFKKTKKQRKKKKVLSQGVPPGTSISDTQPVDAKLSRRR